MNIDFVTTDAALTEYMKLYYVSIALFGFNGMLNDGPESVFSQVEMKFTNAALTMAKNLATDMYLDNSGGGSRRLTGFSRWYDDGQATGFPAAYGPFLTVGGITRSDVMAVGTTGGLNAYSAAITNFSLAAIQQAFGESWFGPDHVDMIVVTQNGWNLVWNALQPLQRFVEKDTDIAQAGFQSLKFNMADLVVDKYMPATLCFGLNTNYIEWYMSTNPMFQFGWTGFKEAANTIDVAGQFLAGSNIVVANPRSGFKLYSALF
jgi:hypothetical protein